MNDAKTQAFVTGLPSEYRYLQVQVDNILADQFTRARKIVEGHRPEVERVADTLLTKGSTKGSELRDLVAQQPRLKLVPPQRNVS